MTLIEPLQLAAAAGVIVPVLIHLFGRPRPRLARFSSLMFLRAAHRRRHTRTRLRRLLWLIVRCLAVLLLALMLALPLARSRRLAAFGSPHGATAVVADVSASMLAHGEGGGSALAAAARAAQAIIHRCGPANVLVPALAASHLRPLEGLDALGSLTATRERGRLAECLGELLALRDAPRIGTIYLLTDLQATSLGHLPPLASATARVVVVDVGQRSAGNAAVISVEAPTAPVLGGRRVSVEATTRAWGDVAGEGGLLSLLGDGVPEVSTRVPLTPDAPAVAQLDLTPDSAGPWQGEVGLAAADAFPIDDRRTVAFLVRDRLRVGLIGDAAATRFIRAALDPYPPGDDRRTVEVSVLTGESLNAELLGGLDAAIVAQPAVLADDGLAALRDEAREGLGVLVFAGEEADAQALEAELLPALGFEGVAPGEPRVQEDARALAEVMTDRPPLAGFAHPGAGDLSAARFTTIREVSAGPDAMVLARFDDGTPALIESAVGRGRTLLLPTAPAAAWSDLVRRPEYVPLMHRLVAHLSSGRSPAILDAAPGETVVGSIGARPDALTVHTPGGTAVPLKVDAGRWRFTAEELGAYVLSDGEEDIAAFAVNLDPSESDPRRLSEEQVRSRLRPLDVEVVSAAGLDEHLRAGAGAAVDLSSAIALLALLILGAEAVASLEGGPAAAEDHERDDEPSNNLGRR